MLDRGLGSIENIGWEGGDIRVVGSCLEQDHGTIGVLTQPRGEHAASRASANDDDVEIHGGTLLTTSHGSSIARVT